MDDNKITYFAATDSRGKKVPFGIRRKDRSKHTYVIGKTGMGKSTLLENMAIQDIQNGEGMAFIDPHGSTAERLLEYVPEHRIKDVLYFAPFDMEYPISFNVMEDVGPDKRHLVANGLMSTFEKIWVDAWSARMAYILNNTILALLEYPGSTLLSVNRMLSDKEYRKKVVENTTDVSVKSFWIDEFGKYTEKFAAEATPAIQNKVGQFTSNPLIRNIIGQPESTFDIRKMMDEKKILIINLSKGRVGEGNANLLGSMLITKIYLAAMSRADKSESELRGLPNFYLYVDEFQSFANKSFADILSEARKYKLNLTIAHQYIEQMEEEVRAAVFGNVGTMITFRVGAYDAETLEKEFAPQFTAVDLVNLGVFQIYLKLMIDGVSSQPFSAVTLPRINEPARKFTSQIMDSSRSQFGRPRAEVEARIKEWHESSRLPAKSAPGNNAQGAGMSSTSGSSRPMRGPDAPNTPREMLAQINQNQQSGQTNNSAPARPIVAPVASAPSVSQSQPGQVAKAQPVQVPKVQPAREQPLRPHSPHSPQISQASQPPQMSQAPQAPAPRVMSLSELKSRASSISGSRSSIVNSTVSSTVGSAPISPIVSPEKSKKDRSPENVAALRAALAGVVKDQPKDQPRDFPKDRLKDSPPLASAHPPSAAAKEIPKDLLEKVLTVEAGDKGKIK